MEGVVWVIEHAQLLQSSQKTAATLVSDKLTMINMSVVCDDFLNDRRSDFRLWWRWWRRWRRRGRATLFLASNDDLVLDHLATRGRRWLPTTDDKLLPLPRNQLSARTRRRQGLLAVSNRNRVLVFVATITTVITVLMAESNVFALDLATSNRRPLAELDLLAFDVDLAGPRAFTATTTEDDVFALDLTGRRSSWPGLVTMADGDIGFFALDLPRTTGRRLTAADADVVPFDVPHRGRRPTAATADDQSVGLDIVGPSRARVEVFLSSIPQHHLASAGARAAVVIVVEEVGHAAAGVTADATPQFQVELIVAAVAAAAIAVEVALALFVQLGCGVAPRHVGQQSARGGRSRGRSGGISQVRQVGRQAGRRMAGWVVMERGEEKRREKGAEGLE